MLGASTHGPSLFHNAPATVKAVQDQKITAQLPDS
jgi:hypothetical protein